MEEVLTSDGEDTLLPIYVQPRASRTALVGLHDGRLKLALAAPPVEGKANRALFAWLARTLGVAKAAVILASGQTGRRKRVRVTGLGARAVAERLGDR